MDFSNYLTKFSTKEIGLDISNQFLIANNSLGFLDFFITTDSKTKKKFKV